MAAEQVIEHAERVMVMHVRFSSEVGLLDRVFPVSGGILEEHDGEYHMHDDCLGIGELEIGVVIDAREL